MKVRGLKRSATIAVLCHLHLIVASPYLFWDQPPYEWGVIGDSWASGVTYSFDGYSSYAGNNDECLRLKSAYGAQLSQDNSWVPGGIQQSFHFAACSGATLNDKQMDVVGKPNIIVMQAWGDNIGLYDVFNNCLFHYQWKDYGPEYPDQNGECAKAIARTESFITQSSTDMRNLIGSIKKHPAVAQNPDFRLYVLGLVHFFNIDSPDSDWCDDVTFVLGLGQQRYTLKKPLRAKLNDLIQQMNDNTQSAISDAAKELNDPKISFMDISPVFNHSRFCEKGHTLWDQYFGDEVSLWNLSPDELTTDVPYNKTGMPENDFIQMHQNGSFMDFLIDNSATGTAGQSRFRNWGLSGPTQNGIPAFALRVLHPKIRGHTAIKHLIISRFENDLGTAEKAPPPPPTSTQAAPKCKPTGPFTDQQECGAKCPGFECKCQPAGDSYSCWCHCS